MLWYKLGLLLQPIQLMLTSLANLGGWDELSKLFAGKAFQTMDLAALWLKRAESSVKGLS